MIETATFDRGKEDSKELSGFSTVISDGEIQVKLVGLRDECLPMEVELCSLYHAHLRIHPNETLEELLSNAQG